MDQEQRGAYGAVHVNTPPALTLLGTWVLSVHASFITLTPGSLPLVS